MLKYCKYCGNPFEAKDKDQQCCNKSCAGSYAASIRYNKSENLPAKRTHDTYKPKTNCFGWDKDRGECFVLTKTECLYSSACPFFKTKAQHERDRKKAEFRLKMKYN